MISLPELHSYQFFSYCFGNFFSFETIFIPAIEKLLVTMQLWQDTQKVFKKYYVKN